MAANQASNGTVHEVSPIARWYDNRSIFITGATGFMGKVLVEKLLSSCPGINQVFVLLRRKKDISPEARLEQLKQTPIFDNLRQYFPQRLEKLVAISGDILQQELGISQEDQKTICSSVSVVFHSAATVKFDEALRLSVTMNILGARRLLHISRKMQKLEAFVHVSTAYCNCDKSFIEEIVYPPPGDIDRILQCLECMDDDMLDAMTPRLIGNRPNTYTFTKAMAEHILVKEAGTIPLTIVRPSIVTAALKMPLPGWVDNLNGPTGMLTGAGKGVLRTLLCRRDMKADLIPVDLCINTIITAAWNTAKEGRHAGLKVYNATTGAVNPILWGDMEIWGHHYLVHNPFDDILWYPGGSFKSNRLWNSVCISIFHMLPAYIIDFSTKIFSKKPRPSMVKVHAKLQKAVQALEYFTNNEWSFANNNVQHLLSKLTDADKKLFDFDARNIKWLPYIEQYVKGIRKYILKEDDKNIPKAKQHIRKMYILHCFSKVLIAFTMWKIVTANSELARRFSFSLISNTLLAIKKLTHL